GAPFFLPCTQRFTSIKAAAEMLRFVRNLRGGRDEPVLMIHEFAPGMAPDPVSIRNAVGAARALELPADWRELAESVNRGEPLALVPSSHYAREMSRHMQALNLTPRVEEDHGSATSLRNLTRRLRAVLS
ncbi:hypothetical protein, partial [Parvibaculum sp.]|uniref:hypothetical protein n=1 Tax=Parvibaculum sp. TaxID=2024848 RepID=UPI003C7424E3